MLRPARPEARFGLYVIGDEILSGKRADRHLAKVISILAQRGLALSWARFLPDERDHIAGELRRSLAGGDIVFSCGGIGATPDDHTRQAAAAALEVGIELHPQARTAILAAIERRGVRDPASPEAQRALRMGEFPRGARLIDNPYNGIPGFSVDHHHFVPGFPVMAWPMIEAVLDADYADRFHSFAATERSMLLFHTNESSIIPFMLEVEERFPGVRTFSLPSVGEDEDGRPVRRHIELGVKGAREQIEAAWALLRERVSNAGMEHEVLAPGTGPRSPG